MAEREGVQQLPTKGKDRISSKINNKFRIQQDDSNIYT